MLSHLAPTLRPALTVSKSPVPSRLLPHFTPRLRLFSMSSTIQHAWGEKMPRQAEEMSTFLCVCPDLPDSKRMSVRPQHLADAKIGHENGWIVKAGATFSDDTRQKMTGSWFLLREESSEGARERLSKDIYTTGGAWDIKNATITPVAVAKH